MSRRGATGMPRFTSGDVMHLSKNLGRLQNASLHTRLLMLAGLGGVMMLAGVGIALLPAVFHTGPMSADDSSALLWRVFTAAVVCGLLWLSVAAMAVSYLLAPLTQQQAGEQARDEFKQALDQRTHEVRQLLEFSQIIQGAGKDEQIFASLGHFLQTELKLAGLTILAHEPDAIPSATIKASYPADLMRPDRTFSDMDCSMCPSLRQHLPRQFKPEGCPVRCSIDECITLGAEHSAYCIPFSIGRKLQIACHMLLPKGLDWTDERRQLAQTYVNTATSTLVSLNLLAEAEKQSMTDPLTGLYNRRSMDHLMEREVALSERHGNPLSLVMIDMDKFKQINDTHGHAAGDHLLKAFADCVRITLRKTDLAFRYGGDEFVIALPQTSITMAQQCVNKLRQAFGSVDFSSAIANLDSPPTLSIGLVERSKQHNVLTLPNLLAAADLALYDAKAANRNCVKVYRPPEAA
jgi:diguanylate cyclase (GGDEF)-like protein